MIDPRSNREGVLQPLPVMGQTHQNVVAILERQTRVEDEFIGLFHSVLPLDVVPHQLE